MKLSELLIDLSLQNVPAIEIFGVTNHSKKVQPGFLFLACPGDAVDGRDYIDLAISAGAAAILYDPASGFSYQNKQVPVFAIQDLASFQSQIAARIYDCPSKKLHVIGVTGTNGKTSICNFIAQALTKLAQKTAVIGTMGYGFLGQLHKSSWTTPDPIILQQIFAELYDQHASTVAIEVSSHALVQHRVDAVNFDMAVFTQLSRDHLDYHQTMEEYGRAKMQLFQFPGLKHGVINWDDALGQQIINDHSGKYPLLIYSLNPDKKPKLPTLQATSIRPTQRGFQVAVTTPWGAGEFLSPIIGRFNISNLLAVLGVLLLREVPLQKALELLSQLHTVNGRMQLIHEEAAPGVVVDYSHTPDSLEKALQSIREHTQGQLWCVFGCGGDRDKGKRAPMGEIAEKYSDISIITNDNPRTENPTEIANNILAGFSDKQRGKIILDRAKAIDFAIDNAKQHDMILIAGKGHEDYQIIGDKVLEFSDYQYAKNALLKRKVG